MDEPELSAESQTDRRRTGEHPATSRQHPTHNDSKRQGQRRDRNNAAGHEIADACVYTAEIVILAGEVLEAGGH
jgi:hypothetical protein